MKNFPILKWKHFIPYKVYNKTYLHEINNLVYSIFQYSEFMIPDYKERDIELSFENDEINLTLLKYHEFIRIDKDMLAYTEYNQPKMLSAGTVIISNARAEGTVDKHPSKNDILMDINNYFFQPRGWGSYYIFFFKQDRLTRENYYQFFYDKYAEENYGRSLYFAFDNFYTRYFSLQPKTERSFNNGINKEVVLSARNMQDKTNPINLIVDKAGKIWSNYLTNPVMSFTFLENSVSDDYGEEIIIDTTWDTSTFERSNIARYNIVSKETKWPTGTMFKQIYAEII